MCTICLNLLNYARRICTISKNMTCTNMPRILVCRKMQKQICTIMHFQKDALALVFIIVDNYTQIYMYYMVEYV